MTGETLPPPPDVTESVGLDRLAADLRLLGLRPDQDLLVHCSLGEIGWVDGGPATLLQAIRDVAGGDATIVVSAQTPLTSRTSEAFRSATAGLSRHETERFAAEHAVFDPETTPPYRVGQFAEHVLARPGARRSAHPQASFAALGPAAVAITSGHVPDCHLGSGHRCAGCTTTTPLFSCSASTTTCAPPFTWPSTGSAAGPTYPGPTSRTTTSSRSATRSRGTGATSLAPAARCPGGWGWRNPVWCRCARRLISPSAGWRSIEQGARINRCVHLMPAWLGR